MQALAVDKIRKGVIAGDRKAVLVPVERVHGTDKDIGLPWVILTVADGMVPETGWKASIMHRRRSGAELTGGPPG